MSKKEKKKTPEHVEVTGEQVVYPAAVPCADVGELNYEFHALCENFSRMSLEDFAALENDIAKHGPKLPVVLYEGKILDGRHIFLASKKAGKVPTFVNFEDVANGQTPEEFVISKNEMRRHESKSQSAISAAQFKDHYQTQLKKLKKKEKSTSGVETWTELAARDFHVSSRWVGYAATVVEYGNKRLIDAVSDGKLSLSRADELLKCPKHELDLVMTLSNDQWNRAIDKLSKQKEVNTPKEKKAKPAAMMAEAKPVEKAPEAAQAESGHGNAGTDAERGVEFDATPNEAPTAVVDNTTPAAAEDVKTSTPVLPKHNSNGHEIKPFSMILAELGLNIPMLEHGGFGCDCREVDNGTDVMRAIDTLSAAVDVGEPRAAKAVLIAVRSGGRCLLASALVA